MRDIDPIKKDIDQTGDVEASVAQMSFARTVLGQLVNQMSFGNLQVGSRTATLPDGTVIRAMVAGGVKRVAITVPTTPAPVDVQAAAELTFEPPELSTIIPAIDKCFMVIYRGNRVAAIPMAALPGKNWPVIYTGKLKTSVPTYQPVAQFNFGVSGCDSIFLGPFAFQNHTLTLDSNFHWLTAVRQNDGTDVNCLHAVQTAAGSGGNPMLNASGATIYAPDGVYGVTKGVPALQKSHMGDFGYANPRAIGANGTYYFYAGARRLTLSNRGSYAAPGAGISLGGGGLTANAAKRQQLQNAIGLSTSEYFAGGAGLDTNYAYGAIASGIDPNGNPNPPQPHQTDYSLAFPMLCWQGGAVDSLVTQSIQPALDFADYDLGSEGVATPTYTYPTDERFTGSQQLLGWSESMEMYSTFIAQGTTQYINSGQESGFLAITINDFPPALSTSQVYAFAQDNSGTTQTRTPYFTSSDYGAYGWAHLSNGQHVMQAFFTQNAGPDVPHLYLDGADVRAKLEAALNVPLTDVQIMLMDIPLATIQHMT